ncbi:PAS domain-containing protein [Rhizobium leguminosarum]|uniref:PAS domain-containing protein n=1 Tax=Rhizobium leguminosarum TaxID=384 RepID=UPI0015595F8A|nr:PAS domain-containing protein [Rhizobium leguminosarum]
MSDIPNAGSGSEPGAPEMADRDRTAEQGAWFDAASRVRFRLLEATLASIPDFVYAFNRDRRFVYANPAMLALFLLSAEEMVGKNFSDLKYPPDLAARLNGHIDHVLREETTIEDEVFYRSPSGYEAYFHFLWGPVRAEDGTVELVVGVSRDTSRHHALEEAMRKSEARLRAATELAGLGIYSWDPVTGELEWDDRLRAMWGLPQDSSATMELFQGAIHPDDWSRVQSAIDACIDPAGDGRYNIEYRVLGLDGSGIRHVATTGQATFAEGHAVDFIGAAIDMTPQRRREAKIRASEAQFRGFADNSSNLIWIGDWAEGTIIYRSTAYELIWGVPDSGTPTPFAEWIVGVHPDDRHQVERALVTVGAGEVAQFEYRIVRPVDGAIRSLRETSFPIFNELGEVTRIGGITEDLTKEDIRQVYIISSKAADARRLAGIVRAEGYRVRTFPSSAIFLDMAPVLAPGCVLVDLRTARDDGLAVPRELKARSIPLPTIALDASKADVSAAVAAMKAGAADYVTLAKESLGSMLAKAMAEALGTARSMRRDDTAGARIARLSRREREVLVGLVEGGTNKLIGQKLGISPRTVELHRSNVMNRLNANSLTELLQIALAAGIAPAVKAG